MFKLTDVLRAENEDRGDDLSASPFVGGEGENELNPGGEDRGDAIEAEAAVEDDAAEAPAGDDSDDNDTGDDDASSDGDGDSGQDDEGGDDSDDSDDADDSDDGDEEPEPKGQMIPKKRFDAVNDRMKQAERRLEELERQQTAREEVQEEQFDFDGKEKEYMEAVLDGDSDKALALRKEIRTAEEALFENKFSTVKDESVRETQLRTEFDDAVSTLETYNPVLDPDTADYDEALVEEIVELQGGLLARGKLTPGEALIQASKYVMGDKLRLDDEPEAEPEPEPKREPKRDIKKKVELAKKQAPRVSGGDSSSSSGEVTLETVEALSEDEFDSLPESKKRELRGDVI